MGAARAGTNRRRGLRSTRRPNGSGTVFPRKDRPGTFCAQVKVNGKTITRSAPSEDEAHVLLAGLLRYAQQVQLAVKPEQTLGQYLATWLERRRLRRDLRPQSFRTYRSYLKHVVQELGMLTLAELTPAAIENFYDSLLARDYSPTSVSALHAMLKGALKDAVIGEILPRNPTDRVRAPRLAPPKTDYFSDVELEQLLAASRGTRWYALWVVLGTMGLRIGEALALVWSDVDWDNCRLVVDANATVDYEGTRILGPTKSGRSREPYMGDLAIEALKAHRSILTDTGLSIFPADPVFPTERGAILSRNVAAAALARDCTRAGLRVITPHVLRHTAATSHLAAGVNVQMVQEMLGHTSAKMTWDRYGHVAPAIHQEAMAKMDQRLRRKG